MEELRLILPREKKHVSVDDWPLHSPSPETLLLLQEAIECARL